MNVKFRMPKLGNLNKKSWLSELGMVFMGTTISIVLTFGTAHIIEQYQKKKAGRQMAIMVIHDIDNTVQKFRSYALEEEANYKMVQDVMMNIDSRSTISEDSVTTLMRFLTVIKDETYSLDDSCEKIFLNNQNAWSNINNAQFLDLVQTFFRERHDYYKSINTGVQWTKPVPFDDIVRKQMEHDDYLFNFVDYLKELFERDNVRYFLAMSSGRQQRFNQIADRWQCYSDQCKFMMDITDKELKEYAERTQRTGKPLKEHHLVGAWTGASNSNVQETFDFKADHTVRFQCDEQMTSPYYFGVLQLKTIYNGVWELKGDSLIMKYNPELETAVDTTGISYTSDMKKFVSNLMAEIDAAFDKMKKERMAEGIHADAYAVSIDNSLDKIEIRTEAKGEDGTMEPVFKYLLRKNEESEK